MGGETGTGVAEFMPEISFEESIREENLRALAWSLGQALECSRLNKPLHELWVSHLDSLDKAFKENIRCMGIENLSQAESWLLSLQDERDYFIQPTELLLKINQYLRDHFPPNTPASRYSQLVGNFVQDCRRVIRRIKTGEPVYYPHMPEERIVRDFIETLKTTPSRHSPKY